MNVKKIWFGGSKIIEKYYDMKKEVSPEKPDRNIDNLLNSSSIKIELSEISIFEFFGLKEMASSVTVQNIHYGKKNCNLEPFHLSDEYIDTLDKFESIFTSIEKEVNSSLKIFYPLALFQLDVTVIFDGYRIYQFFGTDLKNIFIKNENTIEEKVFMEFFNNFYRSLFLKFSQSEPSSNKSVSELNFMDMFMEKEHWSKISDSETIILDTITSSDDEINFHFINSEDDIEEFSSKIKNADPSKVKVSFLMNTSIFNYFKLIDYVIDHQNYDSLLKASNYAISDKLKDYMERINQLFNEVVSHRNYILKDNEAGPIVQSMYLNMNIKIKYHIQITLKELIDGNLLEGQESDILSEVDEIKATMNKTRKVLESI